MSDPKFGDVYQWNPRTPARKGDFGVIVMYCWPYDRHMDSALILAMPIPDERLGKIEQVWRVGEHEAWKLIDNG